MENRELAKWMTTIVGIIGICWMVFGIKILETDKDLAKSGLEQCMMKPGTMYVGIIWVKDCSKYMKDYKELK